MNLPSIIRRSIALLLHGTFCAPTLVNRTIDNHWGDLSTGYRPVYRPLDKWADGSICTGCDAFTSIGKDLSKVHNGTWQDGTYHPPGVNATGPLEIVLNFTGTAVYVYNIIINAIDGKPWDTTMTNLSFIMDGYLVGQYTNVAPIGDKNFTVTYQVPVYVNTTIPRGPHSLILRADGTNDSLVLFDYAQYTVDDLTLPSHAPFPPHSSSLSNVPLPSSSLPSTSRRRTTHTVITVVAITAVVLVALCGTVIVVFRRRHAQKFAMMRPQRLPSSPSPAPPTAPGVVVSPASFRSHSESCSMSSHVGHDVQELPLTPGPLPTRTTLLPSSPVIMHRIPRAPSHDIDVPGPAVSMSEATTERQLRIADMDRELRRQEARLRKIEQARPGHARLRVVHGGSSGSEVSDSRGSGSGRDEKIALLRFQLNALRAEVDYERRLLSEVLPRPRVGADRTMKKKKVLRAVLASSSSDPTRTQSPTGSGHSSLPIGVIADTRIDHESNVEQAVARTGALDGVL